MNANAPLAPLSVSLRLDPEDAEVLRRLCRLRGSQSYQVTIVRILKEFEQRARDQEPATNMVYRDKYFELAETTEELRKQAAKLLSKLDQAQALGTDRTLKKGKKAKRKAASE